MTTRIQALDAIDDLNLDDLASVVGYAQTRLLAMASKAFKVGDKVKFNAKSRGTKSGLLIQKNKKTSKVLVGNTTWTVSTQLLRKDDASLAA